MKTIYLDNASTTIVDSQVLKAMTRYFDKNYGNASSKHFLGVSSRKSIESSRKIIADKIGANSNEIIFTSGGTESNNFVLKGLFFSNFPKKNHIITTSIEHDSILNPCKWLEKQGAKLTYLKVDEEGFIDLKEIEKSITEKTFLVSIIHGNNEIGTIQNIEAIGNLCRKKGILFHIDACQSFGKIPINVKKQNIDFITLNAHKIHGPKGIGALYINEKIKDKIISFIHGGGQEFGLRSGTENVPAIVGFGKAVELMKEKDNLNMKNLRNLLISDLLKIKGIKLNGSKEKGLCSIVNVSFPKVEGEVLLSYLENFGICCSSGSACLSNFNNQKSYVLKEIGCNSKEIASSLRISLSRYNTEKEVKFFLEKVREIIKKLEVI